MVLHLTGWVRRPDDRPDSHQRTVGFEQMRNVKNLERLQRSHYSDECFSEPARSGKRRLRIRDGFGDLTELFFYIMMQNAAKIYHHSLLQANSPNDFIPDHIDKNVTWFRAHGRFISNVGDVRWWQN